ncbi:FecR family protein [Sneathiella limimaris]|uniref:FecR family protein n=1 Tax=Sneathiella limimaris TaxID=1964213 RepID=UPI001469BAF0|nr:FecR domain-containing protein [Sneathiella limimaris]
MKSAEEYLAHLEDLSIAEQADFWVIAADDNMDEHCEMAFQIWLDRSPEHRNAYTMSVEVWELAGSAAMAHKANTIDSDQRPITQTVEYGPAIRSGAITRPFFWIAAACVILVMTFLIHSHDLLTPGEMITAQADFKTYTLKDGSTAKLDAASQAKLEFNEKIRQVKVTQGGLFVDVVSDKKRPFTVVLGSVQVTAVGTSFSVEETADGPLVSVYEGVVTVVNTDKEMPAIEVRAGQDWQQTAHMNEGKISDISQPRLSYWQNGLLQVSDATLGSLLDKFSKHSDTELLWVSPEIASIKVSGLFQLKDSAELLNIFETRYQYRKYDFFGKSVIF